MEIYRKFKFPIFEANQVSHSGTCVLRPILALQRDPVEASRAPTAPILDQHLWRGLRGLPVEPRVD